MKKIIKMLALPILSISLFSCASTKVSLKELSPVAVIDVEGNQRILTVDSDYKPDEDAGGVLDNAVNKMIDSNNPEILTAIDRINYADNYLRNTLKELGGMEVIEKETVTSSKTYKYANKNFLGFMSTNYAGEGYVQGNLSFGAKTSRVLEEEFGASSLLSTEFAFYKIYHDGGVYPVVVMNVNVFDKAGKKVISKTYKTEGITPVKTYGFYKSYEKQEFVDLFPEVIESVINSFVMEYIE